LNGHDRVPRFPRNGLQRLQQIGKCGSVRTQKQSRKKGSRFEAVQRANDMGKDPSKPFGLLENWPASKPGI